MQLRRFHLGAFSQNSSKMTVSDPGYDSTVSSEIRGSLDGVKVGSWNVYLLKGDYPGWGDRTYELQVFHESSSPEKGTDSIWIKSPDFKVGVDSGQAGFFDHDKYPHAGVGEYNDKESFYRRACTLTSGAERASVMEGFGVVSSSGLGDGCYDCFTMSNENDEIVGAKIIFLETDGDDELT